MGGISDEHVEWAVVGRLKAMLDEPPKTRFNVTQSFALYHADMKRMGVILADQFCQVLSGGDHYFKQELGTAAITEVA